MNGTDHPPSTTSSPRLARRALITTVAALAALAAPAAFVAATSGGTDLASADAREASTTSFVEAELLRAQAADGPVTYDETTTTTAAPTTTTAPPPPPTTTAPPPPPPAPAPAPTSGGDGYADPNNPAAWDRLAQCEAGGNWHINTGNGYYGGLQFSLSSWQAVGGTGYPHEHSRETQIAMGQRLHAQGGWGHWPGCSAKLGYR